MNRQINDMPEGFKMTELGLLPEEWETAKFAELTPKRKFAIVDGPFGTQLHSDEYLEQGVPVVRVANLSFDGNFINENLVYISEEKATELSRSEVLPGDIIVAKTGATIGKSGIFPNNYQRGVIASSCLKLSIDQNRADTRYILHCICSKDIQSIIIGRATGSTRATINIAPFANIIIPLPPLPEQKAIAQVLSTIQTAIEKQDKIISAARELKKSLMRHFFTYGSVPLAEAGEVPLKETEIGPVPEHWDVVRLGDLFEIKQGKALSPMHRRGISPRPFLRTANVYWGHLDLTTLDRMDFTDNETSQLKLIPNDLLVCEGGDIGRTAIWQGELDVCCYQNHLHRLRTVRGDVSPPFYMYWMQAAYLLLDLYGGTGNKTTIPNLSQGRLKSFMLPLPPLPEQRDISISLLRIDKKIDIEENRKAALQTLFKTMLHQLMTGKVRIKDLEVRAL